MSRQQAALRREGVRWVLEDLSGHGTVVAGQRVRRGELDEVA